MNKQINHTTGPLAALHRACANGEPIVEVPAIDEKAEKTRKLPRDGDYTQAQYDEARAA